jgi:hypothetical protein
VFNSDGSARIKVTDKPKHVVLAWRKHHEQLLSFYRQLIQDRKRMEDSIVSFNVGKREKVQIPVALVDSINPEFSSPPLFTPQFDTATQSVVFNCKRTGRFEQKHASAMWAKFCIFNSRPAFDVDLVKQ